MDTDPDHPVPGKILGTANFLTGQAPPVDLATLTPLPVSSIVDAAQAPPAAVSSHPVNYQLSRNFTPEARQITGNGLDIGALER
jgi:hypothetical protein